MSETVKVGRNRPPQNGWASKEEVNELRAEVAELRETNQAMLEEIKGLRAELGGAKRRHFLGDIFVYFIYVVNELYCMVFKKLFLL